jgi:hypothetical protein
LGAFLGIKASKFGSAFVLKIGRRIGANRRAENGNLRIGHRDEIAEAPFDPL